jgi:hypothetical protein
MNQSGGLGRQAEERFYCTAGLAARAQLENLPQIENFEIVGYNPLPNPGDTIARGRNGPVAIAGNCLYVGNRIGRRTGTTGLPPEVLIVDISQPNKLLPLLRRFQGQLPVRCGRFGTGTP